MNNKAQLAMVGGVLMGFLAILVGLSLFNGGITSNVAQTTTVFNFNSSTKGDGSVTPALGGEITLRGREVSNLVAINASNGAAIPVTNYTVRNNVLSNGVLVARLNFTTSTHFIPSSGASWNLTYDFKPDTYIDSAGGRALADLVIIFAAIAIMVAALTAVPAFKDGFMNMFGR